jgi:hypothetical protein
MVQMVKVYRSSVAFCKYVIAGLLWIAVLFQSVIPVFIVLAIMVVSAITGVHKAPLVILFTALFVNKAKAAEEYINLHSMRFAHIVGAVFCTVALISFYWISPVLALVLTIILAILQSIASFGYCSAQKLYECVICNSNCCRIGKKIRRIKKDV